jgi:hypothetical protein
MKAPCSVPRESIYEQLVDRLRHAGYEGSQTRRSPERGALAADEFVEDRGEGVDVAAVITTCALLFRRAIAGIIRTPLLGLQLGDSVVEYQDLVGPHRDAAPRGQRAMADQGRRMGGLQNSGDALAEPQRPPPGERPLALTQTVETVSDLRLSDAAQGCRRCYADVLWQAKARYAGSPSERDDLGELCPRRGERTRRVEEKQGYVSSSVVVTRRKGPRRSATAKERLELMATGEFLTGTGCKAA